MIRVRTLDFAYPTGEFRLRLAALDMPAGSLTALTGPSGSGKTTLLELIGGVLAPQAGRIWVADREITAAGEFERRDFRLRRIGMVFQEFELLDYLTVLDNILLPYRLSSHLVLTDGVRRRAAELAAQVAIEDKLARPVGRLSFGERQRVGLCRALITAPEIVLADEPTAGLDPVSKALVMEALLGYARRSGATLVAVTHDAELLGRFERRVDLQALNEAGR